MENQELKPALEGDLLVVDDTLANLRLLMDMLQDLGYKVRGTRDGPSALNAAFTIPPDLILLDINMPGMDGYEVCQQLKADHRTREIPVLFLSALDDITDKVKAFSMGGADYITKPFQLEEVVAVRVLGQSRRAFQRESQALFPGAELE